MADDLPSNNTTSAQLVLGESYRGNWHYTNDVDWYKVTLEAGTTYVFTLASMSYSSAQYAQMVLRDMAEQELAGSYGYSYYTGPAFTYTPLVSGIYYLSAQHWWSWGDYSIKVAPRTGPDDFASGAAGAGTLVVGTPASGAIEVEGDSDWFKFDYEAGKHYSFGFKVGDGLLSNNGLQFYDSQGKPIDFSYPFEPATAGTMYLAVSAGVTGNYQLTAKEIVDDYASFNSTKGTLASGQSVSGQLTYAYDKDAFRVNLAQNVTYTFRLGGSERDMLYIQAELVDDKGNTVSMVHSGTGAYSVNLSKSGTYYLVVSGTTTVEPYTVRMADSLLNPDDIGNTTDTALAVAIGAEQQGVVSWAGDVDMMKVELQAGVTYSFKVTQAGNASFSHYLYGPDGTKLVDMMPSYLSTFTPSVTGFYYYGLASYAIDTKYTWQVVLATDDYAANPGGAASLSLGQVVSGKINAGGGDRDWIAIDLQAGQTYHIGVLPQGMTGFPIRLLAADGSELWSGAASYSRTEFEVTPTASGKFFIEVGSVGSYEIDYRVDAKVGKADDIGNTIATAKALANNAAASGELAIAQDRDFFKFTVVEGKDYEFEFAPVGEANSYLSAYLDFFAANGAEFYPAQYSTQSSREYYTWRATSSGDIFLRIANGEAKGTYTVRASELATDDYANSKETTGALAIGAVLQGSLSHGYDVDWIKVTLEANMLYQFELGGLSSVYASLYNADGYQSYQYRFDKNVLELRPATAGTYYLAVGSHSKETGSYTIKSAPADDHGVWESRSNLVLGTPIKGTLNSATDSDMFGIHVVEDKGYQFTLNGALGDGAIIRVYDNNRKLVAESLATETSRSVTLGTKRGDYFYTVEVVSTNGSLAQYTLTASNVAPPDDHGNTRETATFHFGNNFTENLIGSAGDIDMFRLSGAPEIEYLVTVNSYWSGPTEPMLVDITGDHLTQTILSSNAASTTRLLSASQSTNIYLSVAGPGTWTGKYGLQVSTVPRDDFSASTLTTGAVAVGGFAEGRIGHGWDTDWLAVNLEAGKYYNFDLWGGGLVALMDASGNQVAAGARNEWDEYRLNYTAPSTGKYFVSVTGYSQFWYTVQVKEAVRDITPPQLLATTPTSGAQMVSPYASITLTFNEDVRVDWRHISLVDSSGQKVDASIYGGSTTVTVDPYRALVEGETYTVKYDNGGVIDRGGNFAAAGSATTFRVMKLVATGTTGNDVLTAIGTGATIDGGAGVDTVLFSNNRSFYAINNTGSDVYIKYVTADVGDRLVGIERAVFADMAVAFDIDGIGGKAYRLYQAAFNRAPDQGGVGFWMSVMDKGLSLSAVAAEFVASPEFKSMYGANTSNAAFVDLLYNNVLHRAGDKGGVEFWNNALANGFSREELLIQFSESPENKAVVAEIIANGFNYTPFG